MDLAASVRAEQIRALYRQNRLLLWTNVAVAGVVLAALWSVSPRAQLLAWVALMALTALGRSELMRRFATAKPDATELEPWAKRFFWGALIAGCLWGAGTLAFYDSKSALTQIVLTFAIGGMTSAAAGAWSSHPQVFWAYFLCALGPLLGRTVGVADSTHFAMSGMLLAYAAGMWRVVSVHHRTLIAAFRSRFENAELLATLSSSQTTLQESNRSLEKRFGERTTELERQAEALQDAQRLEIVGRLAGGIAHDFNNLLTIILTNIDILEETQEFDAAGGAAVEETRIAARRGADLIRQLLTFSRRQRIEPRVLDCNRVISEMDRLLRRMVGERIETSLALSPEPLRVLADPSQLEQILVNLVSNARDAMPSGGELRISTELIEQVPDAPHLTGKYALLRVEDNGAGMDSETLRKIFDPFFSTKPPGHGSGLGLATVHGIVQQNDGRIVATSEPGWGAQFSVYFPITDQPERVATVPPPPIARLTRVATILVAEDEPTLRSVIRRSLERLGHTVLLAEDGERALHVAASSRQPLDLLITDIVMPNLGGAELARHLAELCPGLAVLFISGYSWGESLPESDLEAGIAYLQKPFDTRALEARVTELLSGRFQLGAPKPALFRQG